MSLKIRNLPVYIMTSKAAHTQSLVVASLINLTGFFRGFVCPVNDNDDDKLNATATK